MNLVFSGLFKGATFTPDSRGSLSSDSPYDIDREDNTVGGYYDYMDYKQWSHRYVVSSLSAGSMTWTASGDASEVRIYSRVDSVPDSIVPSDDTPGDGQLPGTGTEDGSAASVSAAKAFLY